MGFAHLLNFDATVAAFKTRFNIPQDVDIEYYLEGNIENERRARVVFFPLVAFLKGDVRFPIDPMLLGL